MQIMKRRGLVALLGVVLLPILASCELGEGPPIDISGWISPNDGGVTEPVATFTTVSTPFLEDFNGIDGAILEVSANLDIGILPAPNVSCPDVPHTTAVQRRAYACEDDEGDLTNITFTVLSETRWSLSLTGNGTRYTIDGTLNT